jgi:hypothetical protein
MNRTILPLLLAALVFPLAAAAEEDPPQAAVRSGAIRALDVQGPLLIKGKGRLRGELELANPAETRPVVFGGHLGGVRFVDLVGDLRVKCSGRGGSSVGEDDEGHKVYTCRGREGRVRAHGSHFELQLVARRYAALIPRGVTGTLEGDFRSCTPGETCASGDRKRGGEQRTLPPTPSKKPPAGQPSDEEIDAAIDAISGGDG